MIKTKSKAIKFNYKVWENSRDFDLCDVYNKPSSAKIRTYGHWRNYLYKNYDASEFRILSHNCQSYSFGCIGIVDEVECFIWVTKDYVRYCALDIVQENCA
jgi:hypothetical protein